MQLGNLPDALIVVEPCARNTATAIALAALRLPEDAVMVACSSDHHIGYANTFAEAACTAELAQEGWAGVVRHRGPRPRPLSVTSSGEAIADKGF